VHALAGVTQVLGVCREERMSKLHKLLWLSLWHTPTRIMDARLMFREQGSVGVVTCSCK